MKTRALKVAVALALLGLLAWQTDWSEAVRDLPRLRSETVLTVAVALLVGLVLSTWKWSFALRIQGLEFPFGRLFRLLCTGSFFNCFLPTAIGGDAYRIYQTLPADGYPTRALAAVALERLVGLLALLALGAAAAIELFRWPLARLYLSASAVGIAAVVILLLVIGNGWIERWIGRWRHRAAVDAVMHSIELLRRQPRHWPPLVGLSIAFQLVSIGIVFVLFRDIEPAVSANQCTLITAFVGLSAAVPVSINGIGVMEGTFVAAAVALGLDFEHAFVVAMERRLVGIVLSAACGIAYVIQVRREGSAERSFLRRRAAARPRMPIEASPGCDPRNFAAIFEFANDAIIIWEMDGRGVLFWNQAAEDLYGYSRAQAQGRTPHDLLQTQIPGGAQQLEAMLTRYGVWAGELRHTKSDGRELCVEGRLALMSQENGRWLVLEVNRQLNDQVDAATSQAAMAAQYASLRLQLQR